MKNLYRSKVIVTGGRDGSAKSADGHLDFRLGFPKELGGAGDAVNPEQLFAAGFAACFISTLKAVAAKHGVKPGAIRIESEATLSVSDAGSYHITQVLMRVYDLAAGGAASAIVEDAKQVCAYSNATRGNVDVQIQVLS